MAYLSVDAKEFIPKFKDNGDEDKELKNLTTNSALSVDVPEFVPKDYSSDEKSKESERPKSTKTKKKLQKRDSQKTFKSKETTENVTSSEFNPKHDVHWAQGRSLDNVKDDDFNARHDRGWFHRDPIEIKSQTKDDLKRSDSFNVISAPRLSQHHKRQLMHTYSTGFSEISDRRKLQLKNSLRNDDDPKDLKKQIASWSSIVKNTSSSRPNIVDHEKRISFTQNTGHGRDLRTTSATPNTGHSRDLRTMSYDVERDKRAKFNKLKKTSSLLGSLETAKNSSPKSLQKRLSHRLLTESKSLGPYDINLNPRARPKIDIKRKSLVLEAKRSASLKQDPKMDNWFQKDVPATIDLFSSLNKSPDLIESPPEKPTEKRKLTRTSKKVFSPVPDFTEIESLNDNYFFNDKYKDTGSKKGNPSSVKDTTHEEMTEAESSPSPETLVSNPISNAPLSYSSMVKKAPQINTELAPESIPEESLKYYNDKPMLTSEEIRLLKKTKKKEKKKQKKHRRIEESKQRMNEEGITTQENNAASSSKSKDKKRKDEISFDLSEMVEKLMQVPKSNKQKSRQQGSKGRQKKVVISTGVVSVHSGLAKKSKHDGKKTARNKYGGTGIIMDGATPIVKRGKERETAKRKKPTLLKKIIQAERHRKRVLETKTVTALTTEHKEKEPLIVNEDEKVTENENDKENDETIPQHEKPEIPLVPNSNETEIKDTVIETQKSRQPCEPLSKLPEKLWRQVHSRKFREYCDHVLTKEINDLTYQLLITLQRFQDRVYHENPTKFKQRRRFVLGLREVLKHTKLKKIKAVIIAPNLERISSQGGLDDYLRSILLLCDEFELPKIFALNRHGLGKTLKKKAPVSVIGVFSYDGAQDTFKELLSHVDEARKIYSHKIHNLINDKGLDDDKKDQLVNNKTDQKTIITDQETDQSLQHSQFHQNVTNDNNVLHTEAELLKQRMIATLKDGER